MTPSERVRRALNKHDLTRSKIAREAGIDEAVLCRFAAGQPISLANFDKLVAWLAEQDDDRTIADAAVGK